MSLLVAIGNVGSGSAGTLAGPLFEHLGYLSNTILGTFTILLTAYIIWKFIPEPVLKQTVTQEVIEVSE